MTVPFVTTVVLRCADCHQPVECRVVHDDVTELDPGECPDCGGPLQDDEDDA